MQMRSKLALTVVAVALALGARAAKAGVTITLDSAAPTVMPGSSYMFSGTIQNTAGTEVFLNALNFNLSSALLTYDDTPFFSGPASLLGGGSWSGNLFSIALDPAAPNALYGGTVTVLGGVDAFAMDDLGSQNFAVQASAIPEPGSLALLLTTLGPLAVVRRRSRR